MRMSAVRSPHCSPSCANCNDATPSPSPSSITPGRAPEPSGPVRPCEDHPNSTPGAIPTSTSAATQESPHFYNSGSCVDSRRFSTKSCIAAGGEGFVEKSERWLGGRLKDIRSFICELYGGSVHSKRVDALASATLGVMASASLAVAVIGQALALARGLVTKHAIKQVDRLLSNEKI